MHTQNLRNLRFAMRARGIEGRKTLVLKLPPLVEDLVRKGEQRCDSNGRNKGKTAMFRSLRTTDEEKASS